MSQVTVKIEEVFITREVFGDVNALRVRKEKSFHEDKSNSISWTSGNIGKDRRIVSAVCQGRIGLDDLLSRFCWPK